MVQLAPIGVLVARGLPGADSSTPVTGEVIESAATLLGATPAFWGRYFISVATTGTVEYRHAQENAPLNQAGVRLLPIARQTGHVSGSTDRGIADGIANARDYVTTFTSGALALQGGQFLMFLDVEGSPSLSQDDFTGWAQGLAQESQTASGGSVRILPCVYGTQSDVKTWSAVAGAMSAGVECHGAWIARFRTGKCTMGDWDANIVTPASPVPFPCPILAWQYAGNCLEGRIDCSQTNPNIDVHSQLLALLTLPPGAQQMTQTT
jgi:hypothetical protein